MDYYKGETITIGIKYAFEMEYLNNFMLIRVYNI